MSRTRKRDPGGCWMRSPKHIRAERQLEASQHNMRDEGVALHRTRKPIPPSAWDDLFVSTIRGQAWSRTK